MPMGETRAGVTENELKTKPSRRRRAGKTKKLENLARRGRGDLEK
jgi:hypothetical protein